MTKEDHKVATSQASRAREPASVSAVGEDKQRTARSQAEKFKDLAREVEADEDERAFDQALRQMKSLRKADVPTREPDEHDAQSTF